MSRYYHSLSVSRLRDELDRLEERLSEIEDEESGEIIGIRNRIFYICAELCRKENAA